MEGTVVHMMFRVPHVKEKKVYLEKRYRVWRYKMFYPDRGREPVSRKASPFGRGLVQFWTRGDITDPGKGGGGLHTLDVSDIIGITD